ncbi:orexin receptor [Mactra antiquata]
METTCISVSVLTLCAISVERWYAICYPLRFHSTVKRTRFIILIIWIISVGVGTPEFVVSTTVPYRNDTILFTACYPALWDNHTTMTFQICLMVSLYFAPVLLMTFTYSQISIVLWTGSFPRRATFGLQRDLQAINGGGTSAHDSYTHAIESRKKAARMLVVVVLVFALCFLPNHLLNIARYTGNLEHVPYKDMLALIAHWAIIFNSCVNPVIYNFMSETFRKSFKVAVMSCFKCYYGNSQFKGPTSYDMTLSKTRARRTLSARQS